MGEDKQILERMIGTQSKCCYPGTNVLINKANIKDFDELENLDRLQTTYILSKLYLEPIKGNFDIEHLKAIHKTLFNELYPFAGEFRYENISKDGIPFCRPEIIYMYLNDLLKKMQKESTKLSSEDELIHFLAYFYSEINLVHPFREGNGRTLREFVREYVLELNKRINFGHFELDFSKLTEMDKKIHILGCVESARTGELKYLKQFFGTCLIKTMQKEL